MQPILEALRHCAESHNFDSGDPDCKTVPRPLRAVKARVSTRLNRASKTMVFFSACV